MRLRFGIAFEKDRRHAEIARKLNVRCRVADHYAGVNADLGKLRFRLFEQAWQRFAAIAASLVMRAEVEAINLCTVCCQYAIQLRVNRIDIGGCIETKRDATLVRKHENAQTGSVQAGDCLWNAGKQSEFFPTRDISAFGHLAVDDSITIQKYGAERGTKVRCNGLSR